MQDKPLHELKKIGYTERQNKEYNKELELAHTFIKKQYKDYLKTNKIKDDNERRAFAHAVQITELIAYNCKITPEDH